MVNLRWSMLVCAVLAACQPRPPEPQIPRSAFAAKPAAWSRTSLEALTVPKTAKHLQLIVTPGWAKGEHFAWLIADGTEVLAVYRTLTSELGEVIDEASHRYFSNVPSIIDSRSFVILGSYKPPPPPPPDPGGFPGGYVQSIMLTAQALNKEALRLESAIVK
jgi:hypothetical protein